jgi:polysaccharide biosynthesis transport protein
MMRYLLILQRRWLPVALVATLTTLLAAMLAMSQTPIYQSKSQLQIKKTTKSSGLLEGLSKLESLAGGGDTGSTNLMLTQLEVVKSLPIVQDTIDSLQIKDRKGNLMTPEEFYNDFRAVRLKGTDIIEISYRGPDRELNQKTVQKIISLYVQQDLNAQRSDARAARSFVEQQLPDIEAKVKKAENEVRVFREREGVVDLAAEAVKSIEIVTGINKDLTTAEGQLSAETARVNRMQALLGSDAQTSTRIGLVSETPGVRDALIALQTVQKKLMDERTRFTDDSPSVRDLQSKEQSLKNGLQQRIQGTLVGGRTQAQIVDLQSKGIQESMIADYAKAVAEKSSLEKKIESLRAVVAQYTQRINKLPQLEQQMRDLARNVEVSVITYKTLLARLQEFRIAENQSTGNVSIVVPATLPNKKQVVSLKSEQGIILGSALGLIFGAITALALDYRDRRVKTADEARELLPEFPVLGVIPSFKQQDLVVTAELTFGESTDMHSSIHKNTGSSVEKEAFRSLQANLCFLNADSQVKVLVMSSSRPREGKSTVAANLAIVTSELGRRVLLVDADMRKPSQHRIWHQEVGVGLSGVLTGQTRFEDAVIELDPNLYLLTAGFIPPNPIALLDSSQMGILIAEWSKMFDLVIIDAPPLTVAADAVMLSKQSNGIVFVCRPGVADKDSIDDCKEILKQSSQTVLGMVINGVQLDESRHYKDYYYSTNGVDYSATILTMPANNSNGINEPTESKAMQDVI